MKNRQLFKAIGLMSGTSMDGIDAAWIETDGLFFVRLLGTFSVPHDKDFYMEMKLLEKSIKDLIRQSKNDLPSFKTIVQKIDLLHARAVLGLCQKYKIKTNDYDVIGYHGQTIYHQPSEAVSIQLGNPQHLSQLLNVPVVGNIRQNDIQHGGQGAPVAPIYHQALSVRDNLMPTAVINCGGITNVTIVSGEETSDLVGFDIGPGNGLLDRWVYEKTQGKESMDKDGHYALKGTISSLVLEELYEQSCMIEGVNYYDKKPPKSLDIRDFHWTPSLNTLSLEDGCATLAAFTVECIIKSFEWITHPLKNIILVGGGWYHPLMLHLLKQRAIDYYDTDIRVVRGDEIGWQSQYMEAELMAYLAVRRLNEDPITFPLTTGVSEPLMGGDIFFPASTS